MIHYFKSPQRSDHVQYSSFLSIFGFLIECSCLEDCLGALRAAWNRTFVSFFGLERCTMYCFWRSCQGPVCFSKLNVSRQETHDMPVTPVQHDALILVEVIPNQ